MSFPRLMTICMDVMCLCIPAVRRKSRSRTVDGGGMMGEWPMRFETGISRKTTDTSKGRGWVGRGGAPSESVNHVRYFYGNLEGP